MGLLEDDEHWSKAMSEATLTSFPEQIRNLFAIILTTCKPSNPRVLWEKYRESMSEDILARLRRNNVNVNLCYSLGYQLRKETLTTQIMQILSMKKNYNTTELNTFIESNKPLLMDDQRKAYDGIMECVNREKGGIIFLHAPGGTGKTFLINLILAEIRTKNNYIALAMASSGIAATLLDGGRTAHSALKLALKVNMEEYPVWNISKTSAQATVLRMCKIIVWDECTMAHKKWLEALDRTLRDLRKNDQLLGGSLLVLAGDFRQTLPVIPKSTPADELNACLKTSSLWKFVKRFTLKTNIRVRFFGNETAQHFADKLLQIGEGTFPTESNGEISFPHDFCTMVATVEELTDKIYPGIPEHYRNHEWLCERAILASKNDAVHELNSQLQNMIPGPVTKYKSIDTVVDTDDAMNFPIEFLNSLDPTGMPPHRLQLKIGSLILLLRNLYPPKLCNGARLSVKRLLANVIEDTILTGKEKGERRIHSSNTIEPN